MNHLPTSDEINELLANSEQTELKLLRDAADAATNVILVTDPNLPDNPITYVNPALERMTGYSPNEVLGSNCRFLQGADTDQVGVQLVRRAISAAQPVVVELRNYRKDGSMFWNELHLTPIFKDGALRYFVGIQHDMTARKKTEGLFLTAQTALVSHNYELKSAFESKHAYVVEVAKQLKRPLTTILGFIDLLESQSGVVAMSDEHMQYLKIIKDAAETMDVQLTTLLDLTGSKENPSAVGHQTGVDVNPT